MEDNEETVDVAAHDSVDGAQADAVSETNVKGGSNMMLLGILGLALVALAAVYLAGGFDMSQPPPAIKSTD